MNVEIYEKARMVASIRHKDFAKWDDDKKETAICNVVGLSISRRLAEASTIRCPEQKLFFAVIDQALNDITSYTGSGRHSAINFIKSPAFDYYAGMINLDTEYAREQIKKVL